jgi:WD40 repeat protein
LHIFDATAWREVATRTYREDVAGAAFAPGGWLVAVAGRTVAVWQPGWRERWVLEHAGTVEAARLSPDGRRLATVTHWPGGHDTGVRQTRVFDLASGRETGWEYATGGSNMSEEIMREEAARAKRALAGGDTAAVRSAEASWPLLELGEPRERLSADGVWSALTSGSVMVLHDVSSSRTIGDFDHGAAITGAGFLPARAPRWLVTAGDDGTLAVWPLRSDDLAHQTCDRLQSIFGAPALGKLIADAHAEPGCGVR